jgi:hypothetical protein
MRLAIVILVLLLSVPICNAQQPASKSTPDTCKPQPECRLAFTKLKPGAPTDLGAKPSEKNRVNQQTPMQLQQTRDSFRIPNSPQEDSRAR